jgi:quinol monooxygenase YgiN
MHIVHVFIHIKEGQVEEFKTATVKNARNSLQEPGIARFDLIQQTDDPTRFLLVEVYRTAQDAASHKETTHYKLWQNTVESMMAEPRTRLIYRNVFPDESGWG